MTSLEKRKLISAAKKRGMRVEVYEVPGRTIRGLLKHEKETGGMEADMSKTGRPPALDKTGLEEMRKLIEEQKDITLAEIKENMGLTISIPAICNIVNYKLGFSYKKKMRANERMREDVAVRRKLFQIWQSWPQTGKLVFSDESGVNIGMTRLYGRSIGQERVEDHLPLNKGERTTIISSIRLNGALVPMTISGAMNGGIFKKYITEYLIPTLNKGDFVAMDNLPAHKVKGIEEAGCYILYTPPFNRNWT